jgi:methyl acetate hydrolase
LTQANLKAALDTALKLTTSRAAGAPGIAAMATDKTSNFYEGALGTRELGKISLSDNAGKYVPGN